jgi:uncharacterized protein (TIGR02391 family)
MLEALRGTSEGDIQNMHRVDTNVTELSGLHPRIINHCSKLFIEANYSEAVEKSFKVVRKRLRELTGYEKGSDAFGKTKLHVKGAAEAWADPDFQQAIKFLTMSIDNFRNEKAHVVDGNINEKQRAKEYLALSSLAMHLLDNAEIL